MQAGTQVQFGQELAQLLACDVVELPASEGVAHAGLDAVQLGGIHRVGQIHHLVLDDAQGSLHHRQHLPVVQRHQLDVFQPAPAAGGHQGEGGIIGQAGHHAHAGAHIVVQLGQFAGQGFAYLHHLGRGQPFPFHQVIHVVAVALAGGDAAGGGVRLFDVAFVGEVAHLVAHGGRGHAQVVTLGDGAGAYRLGVGDIVVDDSAEDAFLSFVHELHLHC